MNIDDIKSYHQPAVRITDVVKSNLFLIGIGLCVLIWFVDPFIDAVFLHKGFIYKQFMHPVIDEIYFFSIISIFIISFSYLSSFLLIRSKINRQQLHLTMESVPANISYIDAERRYQYHNTNFKKCFQLESVSIIDKHMVDVVGEKTYEAVQPYLEKGFSGQQVNFEYDYVTQNGNTKTFDMKYVPHFDSNHRVIGLYMLSSDITERKQMEEAQRESKERYEQLVEHASDIIYRTDLKGHFTYINPIALRIMGYTLEEALGEHFTEGVVPTYRRKMVTFYERQLRKQIQNTYYEFPLVSKEGVEIWVGQNVQLIWKKGQIVGFQAVARDINERKLTEEALQKSEERFRALYDNNPLMLFILDEYGKVLSVNQFGIDHLGYTKDQLVGKSVINVFYEEDRPLAQEYLKQCFAEPDKVHNWELRKIRQDGTVFYVREAARVVVDVDGKSTALIVCEDITERKQAEKQLAQAQKMEAIGQLTGGIAHDFNNLLSIVSGNLRFLQQDLGKVNTEIEELFEDAMSAVDDGTELTQRLLVFSRSRTLNPEIENVNDTVEKFVRFLSRTLGETIELDVKLPDENIFINVDPSQLENALLNLTLNARDAMPEGGTITISTTRYHHGEGEGEGLILPEGDYIKITVTDTGSGISSEDLLHVYEPFFTTKEVGQGSGLGLSMVYGFTQQSGGSCHISSAPGKDTTVSLYFPEVMDNKNIDKKPEDDEELSMRGSEVILVVEDEPRVRRVALRDLKKLGYKTLEAGNAEMAKTMIKSGESIDLLFSDILMPGDMNGHKLALWTEKNFPEIKIILTSGYNKGEADVHRDKAHPFPLVRKPYSIDKLAKQIRTTLIE